MLSTVFIRKKISLGLVALDIIESIHKLQAHFYSYFNSMLQTIFIVRGISLSLGLISIYFSHKDSI